jgi:isoquinoline 1-oxidoreductase beta subunit
MKFLWTNFGLTPNRFHSPNNFNLICMKASSTLSRRKFIRVSTLSGAAIFAIGYLQMRGKSPQIMNFSGDESLGSKMNAYIFIDSTGKITLYNHRPEMGQGTFESIPMIIAEELEVGMEAVTVLPSPANKSIYGDQMVSGSRSIRGNYELMRKMGASARETLITAAANRWQVNPQSCYAQNATVVHKESGRKLSYGELAEDAAKLTPPQNPTLKDPKDFRIIGTSPARQDIPAKGNGTAIFGIDCRVKGMLFASVERSPVFLGKMLSYDASQAMAVPGVKFVLKTQRMVWGHTREGLAVVADNYWAALQGRKALKIQWDNAGLDAWSTEKIKQDFVHAAESDGKAFTEKGSFNAALQDAPTKIEAAYITPYQAHAPMEPMNCIVHATKDQCDFWGSTQNPNGVRSQLANQCGVPEEKVNIHYTYMGGAFGRRGMTDVPEEAADLSMKTGTPVQVIWSREDDITQGPFRQCSLNKCRGGLDAQGNLVALEHKVIAQEIQNQTGNSDQSGGQIVGGINTEYSIPNMVIRGVLRKLYVPISYWRSVYHSTNCFAHESFIDEMAVAAKKDPLQFRLSLLKSHERYTAALELVRAKSNWDNIRDKNRGKGVAIVERSGSFVAMVVEVARIEGRIEPVKITAAIDSGIAIHPDNLKAQTEGCIVMGLTAAYKCGLTIADGKIAETNFDKYKMLRLHECPDIEVLVVKNQYAPEGAGEAGLPPVAPALTNAIFNLTGKRIRELPFDLDAI